VNLRARFGRDTLARGIRRGHRSSSRDGTNALVNALRLTFPTIVELTGREFFDQVATEYARGARMLPYLWDAAIAIDAELESTW
jgi:hypothetical protein